MKKIILASGSPRRKMLLEWAEVPFEVIVSDTDESFSSSLSPSAVAVSIAQKKNQAVVEQLQNEISNTIVIAADTIVVLENEIIGKPVDRDNAIEIIQKLSGKKHEVITAVNIRDDQKNIHFYDVTEVVFHELTLEQISHYVDQYKPYDKAGAYAIQEWIGVVGIQSIHGDFYNVMGLPVSKVLKVLKEDFHVGVK
ncbi:MAG: septum formation protein Maf [Bacteroidota bacterium]|jgi:septum formation protein